MIAQIEYDETLMANVMSQSGARTPSEAVDAAFRFYEKMQEKPKLADLFGTIEFWPDYDPKEMGRNPHLLSE